MKMVPQPLEELSERMAKDGVVAVDAAVEEAEEPDLKEMELVIKTKMVNKITKADAVVDVAIVVVEKLVRASSVAITTAEVAAAKIAATMRRMVANTRKSPNVEAEAVVAGLTTISQT